MLSVSGNAVSLLTEANEVITRPHAPFRPRPVERDQLLRDPPLEVGRRKAPSAP